MVNWEFFDNVTPPGAVQLAEDLRAGEEVRPSRGAPLCTFKEVSRILAGFPDERFGAVDAGGPAGEPTLAGLRLAREHGVTSEDPWTNTDPQAYRTDPRDEGEQA